MSIAAPLATPWYFATAGGKTLGVPDKFDVAIGGRPYMLDTRVSQYTGSNPNWSIQTVPMVRAQSDASKRPGEQSLNPEDLWRRSAETWTAGAGQEWYDRDFSDDGRFRTSKGLNPWNRGRLEFHYDTTHALTSEATNVALASAGDYLYVLDGTTLKYTSDITGTPSWTTVTAAASTLSGATTLTTDGHFVWICDGNDVYYTTRGTSTYTPWASAPINAPPVTVVRYVKARLIACAGQSLYNLAAIAAQAPPVAFWSHPNADFTWVDVTEGPAAIYLAGYSGDKSLVYRTAVRNDGVQLDVPIVAGELPDGERIRSIQGYLGFLVIGSDLGFRFATLDSAGNISALGDLVPISGGVWCFEPQDRFVWFGWANYDATSTGLGRLDLRTFNAAAPAYASDLMAGAQGVPKSVVTFQARRVFTVAGSGVWTQASTLVPTATADSGLIGYSLADPKTAVKIATRHARGGGSYTVAIATDHGAFLQCSAEVETGGTSGGAVLTCPTAAHGELFEIRLSFARNPDDATDAPTLTRWTLRSDVGAERRIQFTVPLQLQHEIETRNGGSWHWDPLFERQQIEALAATREITTFQEGKSSRPVIVEDFDWQPHAPLGKPNTNWGGTMVVQMKSV